ncbi:MAG: hypothetical protein WCI46_13235, partial [Verrucomicrobiota bacterium]
MKSLIIQFPRLPPPPFDIETIETIEPPRQAIKERIPDGNPNLNWFNHPQNPSEPNSNWFNQNPLWQAPDIQLVNNR